MSEDFYWRNNRDSIITPVALNMFQILANHNGEDFDEAKSQIDNEYLLARGKSETKKHGGIIGTQIRAFQEAGWVELVQKEDDSGKQINITDAGQQALQLLTKIPDFLKAVPHFILALFTRYQLNNPARPDTSKNAEYDAQLASCDIFPYWTLFRIMRSCDDYITADELKRFVFKIHNISQIEDNIQQIHLYRDDLKSGLTEEELDSKYSKKLEGSIAEPKYIMGRLGTQVGTHPAVIEKEGTSKWYINAGYLSFIDEILKNEPVFADHLTEESWMGQHGRFVTIDEEPSSAVEQDECEEDDTILEDTLSDDDPIWKQTRDLLDHHSSGVLLSGPPGTSKTWYASKIAIKLTNGKAKCISHVQFHPSYSYDDFIEGYVANGTADLSGKTELFKVVDKIFLKICRKASNDPDEQYVLVIDEFSRSDPSRIFGELLTYIEKDYRNKEFTLSYSGEKSFIPSNIIILGTMNPYDKSVADLDAAIERRFDIVPLEPSIEILKEFAKTNEMESALMGKIIDFFTDVNKKCPHGFGHTYFLNAKDENDIVRIWNHKLRFIFEKMFRFELQVYTDIKNNYKSIVSVPDMIK